MLFQPVTSHFGGEDGHVERGGRGESGLKSEGTQQQHSLAACNGLISRRRATCLRGSDIGSASCRLTVRHSEINYHRRALDYRSLIYSGIIAPVTFAIQLRPRCV